MNENFYNLQYLPKMHRIGKLIGVLAVIASCMPALTLGLVYGLWPDWAALGTAALTAITSFSNFIGVNPIVFSIYFHRLVEIADGVQLIRYGNICWLPALLPVY